MPEGPECKIFADGIRSHLLGRTITKACILSGRYSKKEPEGWKLFSFPLKVTEVGCKGKFIFVSLEKNFHIFNTLGMTGSWSGTSRKHSRVLFCLDNVGEIYFNDIRNFGTLKLVNKKISLKEKLDSHPEYSKIGLSLYNWNVPEESPYHHFLKTWGLNNWGEDTIIDGLLTKQLVDTTFALYHIDRHHHGNSCASNSPYSVRHIPWEITNDVIQDMPNKNFEFYNYLLNATSASSYKQFISFNTIYG